MPQKPLPKCLQCGKTESQMWRQNAEKGQICNDCYLQQQAPKIEKTQESIKICDDADPNQDVDENNGDQTDEKTGKTRKSARTTRLKTKNQNSKLNGKGRGRRFKRQPFKTPTICVETRTVQSLFHNGSYIQIGDIVSLMDNDDNTYYAQIRGLLIDTYCEKSAFLTWLIPTTSSPPPNVRFDPATYIIGPEEESPRRISVLEFIMHCPSDYFYDKKTPYPKPYLLNDSQTAGYIWQSLTDCAVKHRRTI